MSEIIFQPVVGAGTFGSVLANRLSENANISVLLIEAGSTFSPISIVPFLAIFLQQTANDWAFVSVSQKYSSKGSVNQVQSYFLHNVDILFFLHLITFIADTIFTSWQRTWWLQPVELHASFRWFGQRL